MSGGVCWGCYAGIRVEAWKKGCNMHCLCRIFIVDTAEYSPTFDSVSHRHNFQINNISEEQGL